MKRDPSLRKVQWPGSTLHCPSLANGLGICLARRRPWVRFSRQHIPQFCVWRWFPAKFPAHYIASPQNSRLSKQWTWELLKDKRCYAGNSVVRRNYHVRTYIGVLQNVLHAVSRPSAFSRGHHFVGTNVLRVHASEIITPASRSAPSSSYVNTVILAKNAL